MSWDSIKRLFRIYFGRMTIEKRLLFSHVERDWTILFGMFVLLLITVGVLNFYLFFYLGEESLVVERKEVSGKAEMFTKEELNSTVEFFEDKTKRFNQVRENPPEVSNPLE